MTVFGWDASDFDWPRGPMDLGAAVRDGIVFFTHKATEGTKVVHAHYGEAINRAKAAGMPFMGAYMVPRTPGNNGHGTIQEQVNFFLAYLDAQTPGWWTAPEFFLQVDTEHWGYDDVAPQYGTQAATFLRAQTGKCVLHYAPRWAYQDTIGGDHPLWASDYGTNPTVPYRDAYPGDGASGWTAYSGRTPTVLQYGSRLTIGTQPTCDGNAYRGTIDQFRTMITGGQSIMAALTDDEQHELLKGIRALVGTWPATVTADGKPDGRPVGIHTADLWRYLVDGKGAYDTGRADPAGASSGWYLDALLKQIRDFAKESATASRQPAAVTLSAADRKAIVDALVAHPDTPLGAADKPAITAALDEFFAKHFGPVSAPAAPVV